MKYKGADFDKQMEKWGLDPDTISLFFGKDVRSIRRWRRQNDFPEAVVMLLKLMIKKDLTPAYVCLAAGREIKGITE